MKFNGKNIIFDDDITLTSKEFKGMKLSDILGELCSKTSKLESYMKWLYQYGGVGGGSGSGGGGSNGYSLYVTVGGSQVTGGTLNLSSGDDEWYDLVVKIQNPGGANVRIGYSYSYVNDSGTTIKVKYDLATNPIVLNSSNSYTYSTKIRLNCNDKLIIDAQDDLFGIDKQINCNIITNNYTFKACLAKNSEEIWSDGTTAAEIFTQEAKDSGLNLLIDYDIAVVSTTTYNWSFVTKDKTFTGSGTLTKESSKTGKLLIPLIGDFEDNQGKFEANESDAGYYSVSLSISVDISGQTSGKPWTKDIIFNLVPQTLYLLVSGAAGKIYSSPTNASDRFEFNPGVIGFNLNTYLGNQSGAGCEISYRVDDAGEWRRIYSTIRKEESLNTVSIIDTGKLEGHGDNEHWIDFKLTCSSYGAQYPSNGSHVRYYFYVKPLVSEVDYPWADGPSSRAGHFNIYRNGINGGPTYDGTLKGENLKSLKDACTGTVFKQSSREESKFLIEDITYPGTGLYTTVLNIGLQYSEINSDDAKILTGCKGGTDENYLTITQNSISFGNDATISYYFPKTAYETYSETEMNNFHLLSIAYRLVKKSGNNLYYEAVVYVDGVMEGAAGSYLPSPLNFKTLTIETCNCMINLLDVSYLTWTEETKPEDLSIYQYWLRYKSTVLQQPLGIYDVSIISDANSFNVTPDGSSIVTEDRSAVANIATKCGVPTLVMTIQDNEDSVLKDITTGYDEDQDLSYEVSVEWSDGKNELKQIEFPVSMPAAQFVASIQGSSTKKYKCKNWDLALKNEQGEETEVNRYLYSPNFNKEDPDTFLPEEKFTLKADVVDSSHSNNTSIGKFVNDVTTPFRTGQENKVLGKFVKNCLQGFPIVVYICLAKTVDGITSSKYYYQGVYNFNLGRSSYYNLGYKDIDVFVENQKVLINDAGSGFTFHQVDRDNNNMCDGLLVAEIQGNSPYFDFSQYDQSILFKQGENDKEYMFGDIVRASQSMTDTEASSILSNLVRTASLAGGFLFEKTLKKTISNSPDDEYGYAKGYNAVRSDGKPANQVPNYKKKIIKKNINGEYKFILDGDRADAGPTDLTTFIGDANDLETSPGFFDYQSLSEYYTICMAFGLVDSVQKNMNIKSWDANRVSESEYEGKFYAAFYDMDTCLGINNAGKDTTYFAFSDYWDHDDSEKEGTAVKPQPISIYRDYSPKNKEENEGGGDYYDTASSYLFAVAKYAIYPGRTKESNIVQYWPKRLWALWRTNSTGTGEPNAGCLKNAKVFMEKYFQNNLGKVSIPMINMNYRNKYFVFTSNSDDKDNSFSTRNFAMFNGTRIHKTEDWLAGRFHILDAYFNLPDANSPIQYYNDEGEFVDVPDGNDILTEPKIDSKYNLINNPDIIVLQDIFSQGTTSSSGSGTIDIRVKAREFTPLFISTPTKAFRYLLSANTEYKIYQDLAGLQEFSFGGSGNWTDLNSIDTFPFSSLYINSKFLTNLTGSSRTLDIRGENITMPSLKTLTLTGQSYSINFIGEGKITSDKYPNLTEVNFSNVKSCNLEINGSNLSTLTLSGIEDGNINVFNCPDLKKLNIKEGEQYNPSIKLSSLNISPIYENLRNLKFNYTNIGALTLTNESNKGDSSIVITNDSRLTEVTLNGFHEVRIESCPNLKKVSIKDNEKGDKLYKVTINDCGADAGSFSINSENPGIVDFSECSGLEVCGGLKKIPNITDVRFYKESGSVELAEGCFFNDSKLKYLSGASIVITGISTFQNCNAFTMHESTGGYTPLYVKANVKNLSSTFSCTNGGGSLTLSDAKHFLESDSTWGDRGGITSMASMWYGQKIEYTKDLLISDLKSGTKNFIDLTGFTNLSNVSSMFAWTTLTAYHPKTLGFGSNVSTITFENFTIGSGQSEIAICPDSFMGIIDKVTAIGPTHIDYYHKYYLLTSKGADVASGVLLKNYFVNGTKYPKQVKTLYGLNTVSTGSYDISGLFGEEGKGKDGSYWPELTNIRTTFKYSPKNVIGVNSCGLKYLGKLNNLYESFNIPNQEVNLADFLNWSVIFTGACPFQNRKDTDSAYNAGCFNLKKTISQNKLGTLWTNFLNGGKKTTKLDYLFWNCTVTDAQSESLEDFINLPKGEGDKIDSMAGTFRNFAVRREGAETPSPIILGHFLSAFPNVTDFSYCFCGCSIGKAIPRDFFGRRYSEETKNVYFTKTDPRRTVRVYGEFTGSNIWEEDNAGTFEKGSVIKYNYRRDNLRLAKMFYECTWQESAKSYDPDKDLTEIKSNYFTIGSSEYGNSEGGYKTNGKNTSYYVRVPKTYNYVTGYRIDEETGENIAIYSEGIAYYYEEKNTVVSGLENSEITDLENLESSYIGQFTSRSGGKTLYNHEVREPHHLFIAPDFFYGVANNATSCKITDVFNRGSVQPIKSLEGMIPENLFKNCKSCNFSGTFSGLNITPRHWKDFTIGSDTCKVYVYVPQSFTTNTSLDNAFNFNLIVPGPGTQISGEREYDKFYVLFKNSIPKGVTTMRNSFPSDWIGEKESATNFGYSGSEIGTHYNIMVDENSTKDNLKEGIDVSYFNKLNFNYLITGKLSWVLGGNLFNTAFLVENIRLTPDSSGKVSEYVIYTKNYTSNAVYIGNSLVLPSTAITTSLSTLHFINFTSVDSLTIGASQIQGCTDAMRKTYGTIKGSDNNNAQINVVD